MASLKESGKRIKYPHDLQGFVRDQAAQGRRGRSSHRFDVSCRLLSTSRNYLYVRALDTFTATEAKKVVEPWLVERIADEARSLWRKDSKAVVYPLQLRVQPDGLRSMFLLSDARRHGH